MQDILLCPVLLDLYVLFYVSLTYKVGKLLTVKRKVCLHIFKACFVVHLRVVKGHFSIWFHKTGFAFHI